MSLLVVAVRYFFRRAVETDRELFQGLTFVQIEGLGQAQEAGFAALAEVLAQHGQRIEELLGELTDPVLRRLHESRLRNLRHARAETDREVRTRTALAVSLSPVAVLLAEPTSL